MGGIGAMRALGGASLVRAGMEQRGGAVLRRSAVVVVVGVNLAEGVIGEIERRGEVGLAVEVVVAAAAVGEEEVLGVRGLEEGAEAVGLGIGRESDRLGILGDATRRPAIPVHPAERSAVILARLGRAACTPLGVDHRQLANDWPISCS